MLHFCHKIQDNFLYEGGLKKKRFLGTQISTNNYNVHTHEIGGREGGQRKR